MTLRSSGLGIGKFTIVLALPWVAGACSGNVKSTTDTGNDAGAPQGNDPVNADWTMLGYDLASTYWNKRETKVTSSSARSLVKAWEFDTKGAVTGTPVISGGRAYVLSNAERGDPAAGGVIAIDLTTGSELWRNSSVSGYSSLALDAGILYLQDSGGSVHALDADDGHELWVHKTDEHGALAGFSSPIVTRDLVLVGGSSFEESNTMPGTSATFRGFAIALNKADGTLVWKKHTVEPPNNGASIWSTLSADAAAGVVIAATGNNYTGQPSDTSDAFLALPLGSGADFLWKQQILAGDVFTVTQTNGNPEADFGANPILFEVAGRKLAAGGNKGGDIWVLDRSDGSIVKRRKLSDPSSYKGGIFNNGAWDGSSLLFAVNGATSTGQGSEEASPTNAATLFAFDPLTLDINWERQVNGPLFSPISVANGVGFFGKNKTLQAFDTATGQVLLVSYRRYDR